MILDGNTRYAGFWRRLAATLIDSILFGLLIVLVMWLVYGGGYFTWSAENRDPFASYGDWDGLINHGLPLVIIVFCWTRFLGTPGKLLLGCRVVHADTGQALGIGRALWRYIAYLISMLPLCLGFAWIGWDKRKQGFHDKLARSVVVIEDAGTQSLDELERSLK